VFYTPSILKKNSLHSLLIVLLATYIEVSRGSKLVDEEASDLDFDNKCKDTSLIFMQIQAAKIV
jgi:hypothetical protein